MSVLNLLASALDRKDEEPNVELAERIAEADDASAIAELVEGLSTGTKAVRSDCIKVLYEIGERRPALIAPYFDSFLALLDAKDNRLNWGGMTALDTIAAERPDDTAANLPKIIAAAEAGSVITRDRAVNILITLSSIAEHRGTAFPILIEFIRTAPVNQLPMYAERALETVDVESKDEFITTLESRVDDIDKESKRKRVEKVIRAAGKVE